MTAFLVHYALNALWQVPLLTLACALTLRLLRPGPATTHLLWVGTLLLSVILPLTGYGPAQPATPVPMSVKLQPIPPADPQPSPFEAEQPSPRTPFHAPRAHILSVALPAHMQTILAALYALACLAALARLLVAGIQARRLYIESQPAALDIRQALIVAQLATWFDLKPPLVRLSASSTTGPLLTGLLQPAILIPAVLTQAPVADFAAVMAHELAHLRRRDLAVNLALRIASLPIAFHPATANLHARIRHTRELLTDRLASTALSSPTAYAQSLLTLSRQLVATSTPPFAAGLFEPSFRFSAQSQPALEERIMKLIAAPTSKSRLYVRAARTTAAVTLMTCALATASLLRLTPAALAAQQPDTAQLSPSTPAAFTPAPETLTTPDHGRTWTASTTDLTPTSTTRQTYTTTTPQAPPLAVPAVEPRPETDAAVTAPAVPAAPPVPPLPPAMPKLDQAQMQADMAKLQADMEAMQAQLKIELRQIDPQVQASLEATRKQLASPEFRRQIAEATSAAAKIRATLTPAELQQLSALSQTDSPSTQQREVLHQSFHQQVAEAGRKYREQLRAAGGDQARIDKLTQEFTAEIQSLTAKYARDLSAAMPNWTK